MMNVANGVLILGVLTASLLYEFSIWHKLLALTAVLIAILFWQVKSPDPDYKRLELENMRLKNDMLRTEIKFINQRNRDMEDHMDSLRKYRDVLGELIKEKNKRLRRKKK